jgi:hypothetical protein
MKPKVLASSWKGVKQCKNLRNDDVGLETARVACPKPVVVEGRERKRDGLSEKCVGAREERILGCEMIGWRGHWCCMYT